MCIRDSVKGEKTSLAEVYGGSIVSGTSKPETSGLVVLGKSDVSVEGGTVIGYVVGGNNTNWFGRSVVGKQDDQGAYAFNGKNYSAGSTKVTISGGDVSQDVYKRQYRGCMPARIQSVPTPTRKTDAFWEKSFLLAVRPPARIAAAWFMSLSLIHIFL